MIEEKETWNCTNMDVLLFVHSIKYIPISHSFMNYIYMDENIHGIHKGKSQVQWYIIIHLLNLFIKLFISSFLLNLKLFQAIIHRMKLQYLHCNVFI